MVNHTVYRTWPGCVKYDEDMWSNASIQYRTYLVHMLQQKKPQAHRWVNYELTRLVYGKWLLMMDKWGEGDMQGLHLLHATIYTLCYFRFISNSSGHRSIVVSQLLTQCLRHFPMIIESVESPPQIWYVSTIRSHVYQNPATRKQLHISMGRGNYRNMHILNYMYKYVFGSNVRWWVELFFGLVDVAWPLPWSRF